jgi:predicted aspartyl protease
LILILMFTPALAFSEIYYWIDDQGVQNYTTRLESIPEPYRSRAQTLSVPAPPSEPQQYQSGSVQQEVLKVPFTPGSSITVNARVNGAGPITLILDTGSDRTLITPSGLQKLGLSTENAGRAILQGVTGTSQGSAVWVNSVEVGEAKTGPLLVVVHDADLKGADGLLGRDFLANFHVMIDSKEGIVTLTPN